MLSRRVAVLEPAVAVAASLAQTRTGEIEESRDDKALRSHSEAQAQSGADVIQSARTQKEANLTPWASPYRFLTGEAHGRGV